MIGLLIEILLSWLLLKYVEQQNLEALGWKPSKQRISLFIIGLLIPITFTIALQWGMAVLTKNPYRVNPDYTVTALLTATGYVARSVAFEDLIFRGALLYILVRRLGVQKAVLISAISFGIYHWFSWSLWGQPVQMVVVFLMTGAAGYVWALAFVRTGSLYLPVALHFGIDFANMVLFSKDKGIGRQLLVHTFDKDPYSPGGIVALLVIIIYYTGFPLLCLLFLRSLNKNAAIGKKQ